MTVWTAERHSKVTPKLGACSRRLTRRDENRDRRLRLGGLVLPRGRGRNFTLGKARRSRSCFHTGPSMWAHHLLASDGKQLFALSREGDINCLDVSTGTTLSQWPNPRSNKLTMPGVSPWQATARSSVCRFIVNSLNHPAGTL